MTVDEFLAWEEGRPGRRELIDGRPLTLRPQTVGQGRMKMAAASALRHAAQQLPTECEAFGDGTTVSTDAHSAFQPYAVLRCGAKLPDDAILVPDPAIVVELVLFGVPRGHDARDKMAVYFRLPSVLHGLLVDGDHLTVTHFRRHSEGVEVTCHEGGVLYLDPPGLSLSIAELLDRDGWRDHTERRS